MAVKRNRAEVAGIIEQFLDGTGGRWDWDDFTSMRVADPKLDAIRVRCVELHDATASPAYCGPDGMKELRQIVERLRRSEN